MSALKYWFNPKAYIKTSRGSTKLAKWAKKVYKKILNCSEFEKLLLLLSVDYNWYLREKSLNELIKINNIKNIKFILLRLNDHIWVISHISLEYLNSILENKNIFYILESIEIIEWIYLNKYIENKIDYKKVTNFIVFENLDYIKSNFNSLNYKKKKIVLKMFFDNYETFDNNIINFLIWENLLLIKIMLSKQLEKVENIFLIKQFLLNDKSVQVRLEMLYSLKRIWKINKDEMKEFMFDKSISIQEFIRYELRNENINFLNEYKKSLSNNKNIWPSILWIWLLWEEKDIKTLIPFLELNNIYIKKVSLFSILKLKPKNINLLINELNSTNSSIRKMISTYIYDNRRKEYYPEIENIYLNWDFKVKKTILKLFWKLLDYYFLPIILKETLNPDTNIKKRVHDILIFWIEKKKTKYLLPSKEEQINIIITYNYIFKKHEKLKSNYISTLKDLYYFFELKKYKTNKKI